MDINALFEILTLGIVTGIYLAIIVSSFSYAGRVLLGLIERA